MSAERQNARGAAPRRTARAGWAPFEMLADRYDTWFDGARGRGVFRVEAECVRQLLSGLPRPWLEVGVGTGRFAAALGVEAGVDPARAALRIARRRGISARRGTAESLPYRDGIFGAVVMIVTVCFLREPSRAFRECARVLRPGGRLIVGIVPRNSSWGRAYARKGAEGHPFYSTARFYTVREIVTAAGRSGFDLDSASSWLLEPYSGEVRQNAEPVPGEGPES